MVHRKADYPMTRTGLPSQTLQMLNAVFERYQPIREVILFGSRAKGTAENNSDIDLAVIGIGNELQIEDIAMALDDLPLPYRFDVKALANIKNSKLKEHIQRVGITIFKRVGDEKTSG